MICRHELRGKIARIEFSGAARALPWIVLLLVCRSGVALGPSELLSHMAANETAARMQRSLFAYTSEERSTRTGGRLWKERVVETDDGVIRRLVAVDGRPLSDSDSALEEKRLSAIVADPSAFRKQNQGKKDDEDHALRLLTLLPKAFLLSPAGTLNGCTAVSFKPDPSYKPSTYEERVAHSMVGTVAVDESLGRLCSIEATVAEPVAFGFGILGRLDAGGRLGLARVPVKANEWKTSHIVVHLGGKILLLKSLTRDQESNRTEIRVLTQKPGISDAIQLTRP